MKINCFETVFLDGLQVDDSDMKEGVLYATEIYGHAKHPCMCGCGNVVHTSLNKTHGWQLLKTNAVTSLVPSVYSRQLPCKSHYFLRNNTVVWC